MLENLKTSIEYMYWYSEKAFADPDNITTEEYDLFLRLHKQQKTLITKLYRLDNNNMIYKKGFEFNKMNNFV